MVEGWHRVKAVETLVADPFRGLRESDPSVMQYVTLVRSGLGAGRFEDRVRGRPSRDGGIGIDLVYFSGGRGRSHVPKQARGEGRVHSAMTAPIRIDPVFCSCRRPEGRIVSTNQPADDVRSHTSLHRN
jgi:hypothetical protein